MIKSKYSLNVSPNSCASFLYCSKTNLSLELSIFSFFLSICFLYITFIFLLFIQYSENFLEKFSLLLTSWAIHSFKTSHCNNHLSFLLCQTHKRFNFLVAIRNCVFHNILERRFEQSMSLALDSRKNLASTQGTYSWKTHIISRMREFSQEHIDLLLLPTQCP